MTNNCGECWTNAVHHQTSFTAVIAWSVVTWLGFFEEKSFLQSDQSYRSTPVNFGACEGSPQIELLTHGVKKKLISLSKHVWKQEHISPIHTQISRNNIQWISLDLKVHKEMVHWNPPDKVRFVKQKSGLPQLRCKTPAINWQHVVFEMIAAANWRCFLIETWPFWRQQCLRDPGPCSAATVFRDRHKSWPLHPAAYSVQSPPQGPASPSICGPSQHEQLKSNVAGAQCQFIQ